MSGGDSRLEWLETSEIDGATIWEFTIHAPDRPITGVLWSGTACRPKAPLVCFGHGASGDRHQRPIPRIAGQLAAKGCFGLSLDGPVHGRRQIGLGGRASFWPEWQRKGTVEEMVRDWRLALAVISEQAEVGAGPVGYWGLSMGTIYGAPFVAAEPRISVAVLGLMGLVSEPAHFKPTITAAAKAITCPVFFLWQLEDELFKREECMAMFDAFSSTNKRLHANPGLHPNVPFEELDFSVEFLMSFLGENRREREVMFKVSE